MATHDRSDATVSTREPTTIWAKCSECRKRTRHDTLAHIHEHDENDDADIQIWVRCCGCLRIGFRSAHQNSEDLEYDAFTRNETTREHVLLFPDPENAHPPIEKTYLVPLEVRRVYDETLTAINHDMRVLVGVGIRTIVEGVCKDQKVKGKNLEEKIDNLVKDGVMPQSSADLLHGTRLLGNQSTHESKPLTEESLRAAVTVVEHLLQTVYILPELADRLPKKNPKTPKKPPKT